MKKSKKNRAYNILISLKKPFPYGKTSFVGEGLRAFPYYCSCFFDLTHTIISVMIHIGRYITKNRISAVNVLSISGNGEIDGENSRVTPAIMFAI